MAQDRNSRRGEVVLNRVFAALLLIPIASVMLLIALLVRLESRGPILFRQQRYGLNDEVITVLKFRTMYSPETAQVRQPVRHDPRLTRVGRWLRRTCLDELPQLLNVVRGEMLLVGPQPRALVQDDHRDRSMDQTHPPKCAQRLLFWLLPLDRQEELIGDLDEKYRTKLLPDYGCREADLWYWWQTIRSIAPLLRRTLLRWSLFAGLVKAAGWMWERIGS
jgi:Bacterial sugar transferase